MWENSGCKYNSLKKPARPKPSSGSTFLISDTWGRMKSEKKTFLDNPLSRVYQSGGYLKPLHRSFRVLSDIIPKNVNSHLPERFRLKRGNWQWCPLTIKINFV